MITFSNEAPYVRRWQDGYEIPLNASLEEITTEQGAFERWSYYRLIVPALTVPDIENAVLREFDGDAEVLAQAIAKAKEAML